MKNTVADDVKIRLELEEDYEEIDQLVVCAFNGRSGMAPFVRAIRDSPNYVPKYALVAEKNARIIGHAMLSYVTLEDGGSSHQVLSLSPLSVTPDMQRKGVGSKLVEKVLSLADEDGEPLVVLEGSPNYYPRFGFVPAARHNITMSLPDWASPEAAMVKVLSNDDEGIKGHVVYPPAFSLVSD